MGIYNPLKRLFQIAHSFTNLSIGYGDLAIMPGIIL